MCPEATAVKQKGDDDDEVALTRTFPSVNTVKKCQDTGSEQNPYYYY